MTGTGATVGRGREVPLNDVVRSAVNPRELRYWRFPCLPFQHAVDRSALLSGWYIRRRWCTWPFGPLALLAHLNNSTRFASDNFARISSLSRSALRSARSLALCRRDFSGRAGSDLD